MERLLLVQMKTTMLIRFNFLSQLLLFTRRSTPTHFPNRNVQLFTNTSIQVLPFTTRSIKLRQYRSLQLT